MPQILARAVEGGQTVRSEDQDLLLTRQSGELRRAVRLAGLLAGGPQRLARRRVEGDEQRPVGAGADVDLAVADQRRAGEAERRGLDLQLLDQIDAPVGLAGARVEAR